MKLNLSMVFQVPVTRLNGLQLFGKHTAVHYKSSHFNRI